jgi:hypothetical protein
MFFQHRDTEIGSTTECLAQFRTPVLNKITAMAGQRTPVSNEKAAALSKKGLFLRMMSHIHPVTEKMFRHSVL